MCKDNENALGQAIDCYLGSATGVIRQKYTYTQAENFRLTGLQGGVSPSYNTQQNITYSYDDQGNVLTVMDAAAFGGSQTQTFSYDALNRLLSAQAAGGSYGTYSQRSYVYTSAGNISSFEGAALGYNDAGHKHAVTHVAGVQRYWYDANGNATRRVNGSQDITLAYDAENHVTSITGSGVNATYAYDGDGKRVKATVGATTTVYIGNTYERDNGTTVRKYYYAGAVRVALRTGGNTFYLLNDHLTSTAITTNSSGARLTELRYYAYGGARYDAGSQMTLYRYTGQRIETGTGLYDYGARWFDPAIGRFLAADSIVPNPGDSQALNRYMHVLGNPLKYSDPSGHAACAAGDRACWENEWTWKDRWYEAHGYFDNGNGWSAQGLPVYSDIGILLDTLAEVGVPTIRDILPGGAYGMGQILYGGIMLSIYRPPTVRVFTGQDTIRPIVGLWFGASISGGSQIVDDWFGDLCPSGTCTRPGTWGNVDIRISTQIPNVWEFVTGFAIGLGQSPESLPPGPDTTRAEMRGDLRATGLYGLNGALQEGRLNMFVLQQDAQDHLRLIILTRQFSDNRANYVTANGLYPVGVMPVCVQGW